MNRTILAVLCALWFSVSTAAAQSCGAYPNTLTNGQTADATQVMANFNFVLNCAKGGRPMINGQVVESHASNAETFAIKTLAGNDPSINDPVRFVFESATKATGSFVLADVTSALSITIPANATLGHVSARDQQIILYAINSGSDSSPTVELAVACRLFDLSTRLQSTTAISSSATNPTLMYSATVRSNVPWEPLARIVENQTTAGTWTASPVQADPAPFTLPTNYVRVDRNGVDQTGVPTLTFTKVQFNHIVLDPDGAFDAVTNFRFQPKVPGKYLVSGATFIISVADATQLFIAAYKNGSEDIRLANISVGGTANIGGSGTYTADMNGTSDYLEVFAQQNTGGTASFYGGTNGTYFIAQRVGP
jgi:hypothetical protein